MEESEIRDAWSIEIPLSLLISHGICKPKENKIIATKGLVLDWIYEEWNNSFKSKKPIFFIRKMHSFLVLKAFVFFFSASAAGFLISILFPLFVFHYIAPYQLIYIPAFLFFIVSIIISWSTSVKFYLVQLNSYKLENVLKEIYYKKINFEPTCWFILGSILLTKEKRIHRNDIERMTGKTSKGIKGNIKRWSEKGILKYDIESKEISLNDIKIILKNDTDYDLTPKSKELIEDRIECLIKMRAILQVFTNGS